MENGVPNRHNENFQDMYRSPIIVRIIKSSGMKWVGHVARMEEGTLSTF